MNKTLLFPLLIQDFVYDVCGYKLNYGDFLLLLQDILDIKLQKKI